MGTRKNRERQEPLWYGSELPEAPPSARPARGHIKRRLAVRQIAAAAIRARNRRHKRTADSVFRLFPRSWARHSVAVCQNEFLNSFPRIDFDSVDVGSIIHFDGMG